MRFSIVTPAYNAGKYIGEMLDSIRCQSLYDWELMIVDDGSTDNTVDIIGSAALEDPRIHLLHLKENSGGCFQPRRVAIEESRGEYVVNIDADDFVEKDFLLKLNTKIEETEAELVCTDMYILNPGEAPHKILPLIEDLYHHIWEGKSIFNHTLNKWDLSLNGVALRRNVALQSLELYDKEFHKFDKWGGHHDENLSRIDLFLAPRVAFSDASYFYRTVADSITHQTSIKRFELLNADINLIKFTGRHFGEDSEEYRLSQAQLFHHVIEFIRYFNRNKKIKEFAEGEEILRNAFASIDRNALRQHVSSRYRILTSFGYRFTKSVLRVYSGDNG